MSEFKQYITQKIEHCECGKELPKGTSCYTTDEQICCEDCAGCLEAQQCDYA